MQENTSQMMNNIFDDLKEKVLLRTSEEGDYATSIEGLKLHRRDIINKPDNCFYRPIFALTVQGAKRTVMGNQEYRYGKGHCLIAGVDMPSMNYITDASPEEPYLVVSLELSSQIISQLMTEVSPLSNGKFNSMKGTAVEPVDIGVLKATFRLLDLLDRPDQISVMAPMIIREIHFRLLTGVQGKLLWQLNTRGTQSHQVQRTITWMRENIGTDIDVNHLAQSVNMAPPTFRRHFKNITSLSPTQYHKALRLYEAQRLMLEDNIDALHAGYRVGYESPAQFNREYKRLFGNPPQTNINQLRQ